VSCLSATDCWAAGYARYGVPSGLSRYTTLAEHWNGTRWSVVPSPSVRRQSSLSALSCATSMDCWAIGTWIRPHGAGGGTLAEHWNGSAWSRIGTPTDNSGTPTSDAGQAAPPYVGFGATMNGLSRVSRAACMAVGFSAPRTSASRTLAEQWNGSAWAVVATPSPRTQDGDQLTAVSCATPRACWATGSNETGSFLAHWNGTRWSIAH
jgi:hypothetical protein